MKTKAFTLVAFLLSSVAQSATIYYVDFTSGDDTNNGTSTTSAWKTLARVNAQPLAAGDSVLLKRGEVWREQLTPTRSVVTYGAYGSGSNPLINGSNLLANWTPTTTANVWRASVLRGPSQVFLDAVRAPKVAFPPTQDGQWSYSSSTVYLFSTEDPDTHFSSPGVEWTAAPGKPGCRFGILISGPTDITIDGIDTSRTGWDGIKLQLTSKNIVIQNLTVSNAGNQGILWTGDASNTVVKNVKLLSNGSSGGLRHGIYPNASNPSAGPWLIENVESASSSGYGFHIYDSTGGTLRNCYAHDNGVHGIAVIDIRDDADVRIENCISTRNLGIGVDIGGLGDSYNGNHTVELLNSVAFTNGTSGVRVSSNVYAETTIRLRDTASVENGVVDLDIRSSVWAVLDFDHNLFFRTTGAMIAYAPEYGTPTYFEQSRFQDYQALTGLDRNSKSAPPLLVPSTRVQW